MRAIGALRWSALAAAVAMGSGCGGDHGDVELSGAFRGKALTAIEAFFYTEDLGGGIEANLRTDLVLAPFANACDAFNHGLWQSPAQGLFLKAPVDGPFGGVPVSEPTNFESAGLTLVVGPGKDCAPEFVKSSDSGTLSITAVTDEAIEGHFRAIFWTDVVSGSFRAVRCKYAETPAPTPACK